MQIRRETLGTQIYDLLRDRILRGQMVGGARLIQEAISDELGVSRIPIRDALRRLEADGLVTGDELGRYAVVPFERTDADEIYAIRARLEPLAIEAAATAMTPAELREVRSLYEALRDAAGERAIDRYIELNVRFHAAIYEASGMRRLVRIIRGLWQGVPPLTPIVLEGRIDRSQNEHEEIMTNLAAKNGKGAASALARHIENAGAELVASLVEAERARRASVKIAEQTE